MFGAPEQNAWLTLIGAALRQCGHQVRGDPFGPGGVFSLADPGRNRAILDGAGFPQARIEQIAGAVRFSDFEDYWAVQSQVSGRFASLISSLPADDTEAIRAALKEAAAPFQAGEAYELPTLAVVAGAS